MLVRSLAYVLALVLCPSVIANENDEPLQQEAVKVKLQFTSVTRIAGPLFLLGANGKTIPIQAPQNNLSPEIEVPAMDMWIVGRKDGDKGQFRIIAQGKSMKSGVQILVIAPDENGGSTLTALEGNPGFFKFHTIQYLNCSPHQIAGTANKHRIGVNPGSWRIIKPDRQQALMRYEFFYSANQKDFKAFVAGAIPLPRNNSRYLITFYQDPLNGRLKHQMARIPAPLPAPAKAKPAN